MGFSMPIVWREPANLVDDCYIYSINMAEDNKMKQKSLNYQIVWSAIQLVVHSDDISLPEFTELRVAI